MPQLAVPACRPACRPPLDTLDDPSLLALVARHRAPGAHHLAGAALRELHGRHARSIERMVRAQGADATRADDAVQETFVRVWRNAGTFDASRGTAAVWLRTIARRAVIDLVRAEQRCVPTVPGDVADEPCAVAPGPDDRLVLDGALAQLSVEHREVLALAYDADLSQSQIAARLHLPLGTVKTRTHWALTAMRRQLSATYSLQVA
jgi:RNA polymerase sigma-70 factor (ECF subfamily)